jgi:hypothetical protein
MNQTGKLKRNCMRAARIYGNRRIGRRRILATKLRRNGLKLSGGRAPIPDD